MSLEDTLSNIGGKLDRGATQAAEEVRNIPILKKVKENPTHAAVATGLVGAMALRNRRRRN